MAIDKRLVVVVIHIVVCFEWMNIRKSIRLCLRRAGIRVNGDGLFVCNSYRWRQRRTELRVFVCSVCTHLANIESNSPDSEQHQSCFSPAVSFATCVREKEREIDYQKRQLRRGFLPHTSFHWILLASLLVRHRGIRFCFLVTPILCVIDDKQFAWLPHDRPQTTSYRQNYIYLSIGHRCYIRVISLVVCVLCCGATTSEFHQFLLYIDIENVYIGTVKEQ